jgi:cardiolipin synthase A/B
MSILQPTHSIVDHITRAIETAQKEILLQAYYVKHDHVFQTLAHKLIEKVQAGVAVYCLLDALGAQEISGSDIEKSMLEAGVRIQYFNWLTPWAGRNKKIWYFRNHKRSLIIDEKEVHVGGWCFGNNTQDWIEGYIHTTDTEVAANSLKDFWNMYVYAHKTQLRFKNQNKYTYSNTKDISYTYHAPIMQGRYIYHTHKKLLSAAAKKVILIVPYFAPTHTLNRIIKKASKQGVAVEVFLPRKTDITITDLVAKTYIHGLLKAGVLIYLSDTMIHAKAALFDNVMYIGSSNLDPVSLRYNFENGIYTKDITTIQEFEADVEVLRNTCEKLSLEDWGKRTFWQKFLDKFMKIFRAFV